MRILSRRWLLSLRTPVELPSRIPLKHLSWSNFTPCSIPEITEINFDSDVGEVSTRISGFH